METNEIINNEEIEQAVEGTELPIEATEPVMDIDDSINNTSTGIAKGFCIGLLTAGLALAGRWAYGKFKQIKAARAAMKESEKTESECCDGEYIEPDQTEEPCNKSNSKKS